MLTINLTIQAEAADIATLLAILNQAPPLLTPPEPTEEPPLHETPVLSPTTANPPTSCKVAPIPSVTNKAKRGALPFAEFDALTRREMRRLSMDRRLPGFKLWDSQRDRRLPSLSGVIQRYGLKTVKELADLMGLQPSLHGNSKMPAPAREEHDGEEHDDE